MPLVNDPRPPLPDWVTDAYTVLSTVMADTEPDDSQCQVPAISRARAVDVLCQSDDLALDPVDADYAITRLLEMLCSRPRGVAGPKVQCWTLTGNGYSNARTILEQRQDENGKPLGQTIDLIQASTLETSFFE